MNDDIEQRIKDKTLNRLLKKGKLRGRIDAKCCECIYDPMSDGSWRLQVENCTSLACPLYPVRPKIIQSKLGNLTSSDAG